MPITHDVFLSYSKRDVDVVRDVATRLQSCGVRVWFDEWEIRPGDSRPRMIDDGLEGSTALVLCISSNALGADWPTLESRTFRFRDPLNPNRRFIPLRLDDVPLTGWLAQHLYVDWRNRDDREFERLVRVCKIPPPDRPGRERRSASSRVIQLGSAGAMHSIAFHEGGTFAIIGGDSTVRLWDLASGTSGARPLRGHIGEVNAVAIGQDGTHALTGADDYTVCLWDLRVGRSEHVLEGHLGEVKAVALHSGGDEAISGSYDGTVRVWRLSDETCIHELDAETRWVNAVAYHPDGVRALSAGDDGTIRVWDLLSGTCMQILPSQAGAVQGIACRPDGSQIISGSDDGTIGVWDPQDGTCLRVLEGHTGPALSVAYHPGGDYAISGSADTTVRVWNVATGVCEQILEGHSSAVSRVAYHPDGRTVFGASHDGVLRIWDFTLPAQGAIAPAQVNYTNAKVVLVGEHHAGKSGLALRLAHGRWEHTDSTLGAWATQFQVGSTADPAKGSAGEGREIWLWDFGGQADQRLIHQLYLRDAALAVVVFDGDRDDVVPRLWDWNRALEAAQPTMPKLLVSGRTDINAVRLSLAELEQFCDGAGFLEYRKTSAATGAGCDELREAIVRSIDWAKIPWKTSPEVFRRIKDAILRLKDTGRALTSSKELRDWLPTEIGAFDGAELDAVIRLLAGPGAVLPLGFGDYILLRPELLNAYAQCVIRTLHQDPLERGCISEERVLRGELSFPADFARLEEVEERIVLIAMHKQLVQHSICLRDHDPEERRPTLLVFPSYFRRERPERPGAPQPFMSYRFDGYLDDIYASLVVRLHHSEPFRSAELWRNAADLATADGKELGVVLIPESNGTAELQLHCDPKLQEGDRALFARYVQDHLDARAASVTRLRTYICPHCATPVENREAASRRLLSGKSDIVCVECESRIALWDEVEEQLAQPETARRVVRMRDASEMVIRSEGLERLLVGEVIAIVGRAEQISREISVSDQGIDMEIEFRHDDGSASGKKLYLQLKSGDSHLRRRKRDDARLFRIRKPRHADYWAEQAFPVLLIIRESNGTIMWMEIREHLRRLRAGGRWPPGEIVFDGRPFDVMTVRELRDEILKSSGQLP